MGFITFYTFFEKQEVVIDRTPIQNNTSMDTVTTANTETSQDTVTTKESAPISQPESVKEQKKDSVATSSQTPKTSAAIQQPKPSSQPSQPTQPSQPKQPTNNERLVNFFASKGVTIPLNDSMWNFFTSSSPQSFGAPNEWGDNPIVAVDKYGVKDGIKVWEKLRYIYCPALNKGAKIIEVDHKFVVDKIY